MNKENFQSWLTKYGKAWETKDTESFGNLFSDDALYYWTPFSEPKRGKYEIKLAVESATSTQSKIVFKYEILSIAGNKGIAHWTCNLKRISSNKDLTIDGILTAEFNEDNLCHTFREWWHSNEFENI